VCHGNVLYEVHIQIPKTKPNPLRTCCHGNKINIVDTFYIVFQGGIGISHTYFCHHRKSSMHWLSDCNLSSMYIVLTYTQRRCQLNIIGLFIIMI